MRCNLLALWLVIPVALVEGGERSGPPPLPETTIWVAPGGSDANDGLSRGHALASPHAARDRIRELKKKNGGELPGPVDVLLVNGLYRLESTFDLTPEDSGAPDRPIRYKSTRPEPGPKTGIAAHSPVLSGGEAVGPWRPEYVDAGSGKVYVWVADVPLALRAEKPARAIRELWVDGKRRTRARLPDAGYLKIEGVPAAPAGAPWNQGFASLRFEEADASLWPIVEPGAELVGYTRWIDDHLVVKGVDLAARTVEFERRSMFLFGPGDLYHLEGSLKFLSSPGEWFTDGERIWYVPMERERTGPKEAFVPRLSTLVRIAGRPEAGELVHDVKFEGLTFAHSRWWFEDAGEAKAAPEPLGFPQAAAGIAGAIRAEGAERIEFRDCTIRHTGGYGMELSRGCRDNVIARCSIFDLGAGGIKIGEMGIRERAAEKTGGNTVEDCRITDGGRTWRQAVGVWIGQSENNRLAHNLIRDVGYTGISIGWTWGYGPATAGGNIVEFNEVAFIGQREGEAGPALGDMAGIYTLGAQPGTVIRNNWFHDIAGRSIAWGIYFDEGSAGIVAENNLVVRTTHGGFHQHYGRDNIVRNNLLALGREAQVWKTRREAHRCFTFERNIVVYDAPGSDLFKGDWGGSDTVVARNVYWRRGGTVEFAGGESLEARQGRGVDVGSVIGDPGWREEEPLRLGVSSATEAIGFMRIDLAGVGPRPGPYVDY